jgi:hypothetical protein
VHFMSISPAQSPLDIMFAPIVVPLGEVGTASGKRQ